MQRIISCEDNDFRENGHDGRAAPLPSKEVS